MGLRTRSVAILAALSSVFFLPGAVPASADIERTATVAFAPESWTYVSSLQQHKSFLNSEGLAPVGVGDTPSDIRRSFFQLNLAAMQAAPSIKEIESAHLVVRKPSAWCRNNVAGFRVWSTGQIGKYTDWVHQPQWISQVGTTPNPCGENGKYIVDVTGGVKAFLAGNENLITLGLISGDELTLSSSLLVESNPSLTVTYTYTTTGSEQPAPNVDTLTPTGWTYVDSGDRTASHWNQDVPAPVGPDANRAAQRSFFTFQPPALEDRRLVRATLKLPRVSECRVGERGLEVWATGAVGEETTWQAQPGWNAKVATYAWSACDDPLEIDVSAAVLGGASQVTLGLRASDESDELSRFVFGSAPALVVESAVPPPTPIVPTTAGRPCEGRPYLNSATPTAAAEVQSDLPHNTSTRWEWEGVDGTGQREWVQAPVLGWPVSASLPAGAQDGSYRWRVRAEDGWATSDWSQWCEYTLDIVAPETAPTVSAGIYSGSDPAGGVGVPDEFKLSVNGAHDVKGFRVTLHGSYDLPVGEGGTATLPFTPAHTGEHVLEVQTYDKADNLSPLTRHTFVVAKSPPDVPTGLSIRTNQTPVTIPRPNCATGEDRPWYGRGAAYLTAAFTNRDGGPIVARFQFQTLEGEIVEEKTSVPFYSGAMTSVEMTDRLQDGGIYRWRARGENTIDALNGEWSQWCEFGYDATGLDKPPAVSVSGDVMTLGPNGVEGITGYFYGGGPYGGSAMKHVDGSAATVTLPPDAVVWIYAHDRAGNLSPAATYQRS